MYGSIIKKVDKMGKIKKLILKNETLIFDVIYNTLAFGLYIISMHILLMPYLARNLSKDVNAEIVFFVIIMNIITSSFGFQLGMTKQLKTIQEEGKRINRDYESILVVTNVIISIVTFIILITFGISITNTIFLTIVVIISNSKAYYQAFYRKNRNFKKIGIMNAIFLVNVIVGLILHRVIQIETLYWLPLFMAEGFSTLYAYIDLNIYKAWKADKSKEIKTTFKEYLNLVLGSLIDNASAYGDKILILPVLGKETMNIYYAGTVLSKMVYLVINPINGVILAWMTSSKIDAKKSFINKYIGVNLFLMLITFALNVPLTYLATYFLYRNYFEVISSIVILLSISCAFGVGNSILYNVVLRFTDVKNIKYINVVKLVVFLVAGYYGAKMWGMPGFVLGMIISKLVLWLMYVYLLKKVE